MDQEKPAEVAPTETTTTTTTKPAQGKSNKTLLIVIVIILLLCLCVGGVIAGVYYFTTRSATDLLNQAINTAQNPTTTTDNNGSTTPSNGTSTNTDNTSHLGTTLPTGFPSDIPVYPNATVNGYASDNGETSVVWTAADTPENIYAYYKTNLESQGWTIDSDSNYYTTYAITASKADREVTVGVVGGNDGSGTDSASSVVTLAYK